MLLSWWRVFESLLLDRVDVIHVKYLHIICISQFNFNIWSTKKSNQPVPDPGLLASRERIPRRFMSQSNLSRNKNLTRLSLHTATA